MTKNDYFQDQIPEQSSFFYLIIKNFFSTNKPWQSFSQGGYNQTYWQMPQA